MEAVDSLAFQDVRTIRTRSIAFTDTADLDLASGLTYIPFTTIVSYLASFTCLFFPGPTCPTICTTATDLN